MKTNRKLLTKISTAIVCAAMALSMAACGTDNSNENVQIANPWTEYDSIEEAAKNAGFSFEVPEEIGDYKITCIQDMNTELIDVVYSQSEDSETEIRIRKGVGSDDISGDFNVYTDSNVVTVGDYEVTEKGNNGQVALATWTIDGYSYSVSVRDMAAEDVAAIILQVK